MTLVPRLVNFGHDLSYPDEATRPSFGGHGLPIYQEDSLTTRVYDANKDKFLAPGGVLGFLYDFSVNGGSQGTINLGEVPAGFLVCNAAYHVITTLESSSDAATVALHIESAGDIVAAVAISNGADPWDAGATVQGVPDWATAGDWVLSNPDNQLVMTIAGGEDLTAGKFRVFLSGYQSTMF